MALRPIGKKGKTEMSTVIVFIVVFGLVAYFFNFNGFGDTVNGWSGTDSGVGEEDTGIVSNSQCPTDGTTTYTLNVQDALTSSATDVDSEYFVFDGNKLVKSGTVAGSGTFDVACGKDYKAVLLNTTAQTGAYAKTIDLKARISEDTINEQLYRFGQANIIGIQNPSDPLARSNATLGANGVVNFELLFKSNLTQRGFNKPLILCEANVSAIKSVSIGSFSDGTPVGSVAALPKRVTASAGYQYYAWEYGKILTPEAGVVGASGTITALESVDPADADQISCIIADQATWKTSDFKTAVGIENAFKTGAENSETLSDVGGPDATASTFNFANEGGY